MRRHFTILAIAAALLLFPSAGFGDPPAPDDQQLFANTVTTMRGLPEPPYLTFVTNVTTKGMRSLTLKDINGVGKVVLFSGKGEPSASWATSYRRRDDTASVVNAPPSHLLSHSPFFIPTWRGVFDWFHFGIEGRPFLPSQTPQTSTASDANVKVIGTVKAISADSYHITAANPAPCPSGEQGRHLHLEPRGDIKTHPLTDVTIDLASTRFCSMRFFLPLRGGKGFSELHFGTVNGYWMTTSDDADIHVGIGWSRAEFHVRYDEMRFPDTIDDAVFASVEAK